MDYSSYLQLPELLTLQLPVSEHNREELIFIVTHQAMELWLKVLLVEIKRLISHCSNQSEFSMLIQCVDHCNLIWNTLIAQFTGIRTLTPIDFLKFRRALLTASGAQSQQYLELEIILGVKSSPTAQITLRNAVLEYLRHACNLKNHPLEILYQTNQTLTLLIDKLVELDELFSRWKEEHVRLVRRMIGNKIGTGSTHLELLEKKVEAYIFPELWSLKNEL